MNRESLKSLAREDIASDFDPQRFARRRLPIVIGAVSPDAFGPLPSCLDMLIKLPGGPVVLPAPYRDDPGLSEFMRQVLEAEDDLLQGWRGRYHLYLTCDRRRVEPGRSHRNEGWHFDGMQGARYPVKMPVCHQYVMSTRLTTEFTDHPTDATGLDEARHNWFRALGAQIPEDAEAFQPNPGEICMMTAYQLHRSPVAGPDDAGYRTFIRLDISLKKQDRFGNTANPDLPAPWPFVARDLPAGLAEPIRDSSWGGAHKFNYEAYRMEDCHG